MTQELQFLLAVDTTWASTCTTCAKEPVVDDEDDSDIEELSSDSSSQFEGDGFVLTKRAQDEGALGSQTVLPNPSEDVRCEGCKKSRHDQSTGILDQPVPSVQAPIIHRPTDGICCMENKNFPYEIMNSPKI